MKADKPNVEKMIATNNVILYFIKDTDLLHREDGPAIIYPDGVVSWYINDRRIESVKEYQKKTKLTDEEMALLVLKYGEVE